MTKTLRPVLRPPEPDAEPDAEEAAELAVEPTAAVEELLEELELQAASATAAAIGSASASFLARLRVIFLVSFQFVAEILLSRAGTRVLGCQGCGSRRSQRPAVGRKTLASSSAPVTMPVASWLKLVSRRAFWMPAKARTARTTPISDPLPPKIDTPASSTIATTSSSRPRPLSCTAVSRRKVHSTPAREQMKPETMKRMVLMRLTLMPANWAASALAPMA